MRGEVSREAVHAESWPELAWLTSANGESSYFNRRALEYFGLPEGDATGWHWQWAVHPTDLAFVRRAWTSAMAGREPCSMKLRLRRADGAYQWHLVSSTPLERDAGVWLVGAEGVEPALTSVGELALAGF